LELLYKTRGGWRREEKTRGRAIQLRINSSNQTYQSTEIHLSSFNCQTSLLQLIRSKLESFTVPHLNLFKSFLNTSKPLSAPFCERPLYFSFPSTNISVSIYFFACLYKITHYRKRNQKRGLLHLRKYQGLSTLSRRSMVHSILVPNQISNDFFSILVGNFNENKNLQLTEQKQEINNSIMFIVNWFWVSWEGRIKGLTKQAEG